MRRISQNAAVSHTWIKESKLLALGEGCGAEESLSAAALEASRLVLPPRPFVSPATTAVPRPVPSSSACCLSAARGGGWRAPDVQPFRH